MTSRRSSSGNETYHYSEPAENFSLMFASNSFSMHFFQFVFEMFMVHLNIIPQGCTTKSKLLSIYATQKLLSSLVVLLYLV